MFRNGRGIIQDRVVLRFSMAADDKKFIPLPLASEKSYQRSTDDDQREWDVEKKYRYNAAAAKVHITSFFSARLPMRMTAAATMASTAGFRP